MNHPTGSAKLQTKVNLTKDQLNAFQRIKVFLQDPNEPAIVIKGSAGTGKSFLTKYMTDYIVSKLHMNIVAVAPTHKARRVMHKFLNKDRFIPIPTITVASVLSKMREHSYIGSHRYSAGSTQKMDNYDCIIIDEISMVSDEDLDILIDYICEHDKKLIMIGDDCQIPAPSQKIVRDGYICYKPDSDAFNIANLCELNEIIRQAKGSPIITLATYIRDNIAEAVSIQDIFNSTGVDPDEICLKTEFLYEEVAKDIRDGKSTRVISYTNAAVRNHNNEIRKVLGYKNPFVEGELLTGYNNVGFPVPVIENGSDYRVIKTQKTDNFNVMSFGGLSGYLLTLQDTEDLDTVSERLFFISVKDPKNSTFMKELVKLAEKVNKNRSTKNDFKEYCKLKNRVICIDDVYKYENKIMTDTELKQLHPLLFTRVMEVIDDKSRDKLDTELADKIDEIYEHLILDRIRDNKMFGDGEVFADRFKVVEKDIYYGYSVTGHKCQGSTYQSVYVDEQDFKKLANKWNYRHRALENRYKEQNQLKYVAYTRASEKLRIFMPEW